MTASVQSMKQALKKFQQTHRIEDLFECAFTTGLGYLFRYIRGHLQQLHFEKVIFYAKRMKDMLGILLPSCVHFMEISHDGHSFSSATQVQKAEGDIVSQVLKKLDEGPKEGDLDQIDGPTPVLGVFHKTAMRRTFDCFRSTWENIEDEEVYPSQDPPRYSESMQDSPQYSKSMQDPPWSSENKTTQTEREAPLKDPARPHPPGAQNLSKKKTKKVTTKKENYSILYEMMKSGSGTG